jgi:hypothetical protein
MSVWRVYLISLCSFDRDWDGGVFDTEESAQVALDRAQVFRVRINAISVSCIYVLESLPAD